MTSQLPDTPVSISKEHISDSDDDTVDINDIPSTPVTSKRAMSPHEEINGELTRAPVKKRKTSLNMYVAFRMLFTSLTMSLQTAPLRQVLDFLTGMLFPTLNDDELTEVLGQLISDLDSICSNNKIKSWDQLWTHLKKHSSYTTSYQCVTLQKLLSLLKKFVLENYLVERDSASHTSTKRRIETGTTSTSYTTAAGPSDIADAPSQQGSIFDIDGVSALDLQAVSTENSTEILYSIFSKNSRGKCTYKWPMKYLGSHVFQLKIYPSVACKNMSSRDWWKTAVKTIQGTTDLDKMQTPLLGVSAKVDAEWKIRQGIEDIIQGMSQLRQIEQDSKNPNLVVSKELTSL